MLNGGSLNSHALNAPSGVDAIIGSGTLVFLDQNVAGIGSGLLVEFEQNIGIVASGNLIDIEQFVNLHITGSGTLVDIEQLVSSISSGTLVNIEQRQVLSDTRVNRAGWDCTFTIAGVIVPNNMITGDITIDREESSASLMQISIIPQSGVQNLSTYIGKTVTLDVHTVDGTFRLYTGVIDIPEVDLINKKIRFRCTDRRSELINSQLANTVKNIGFFNDLVFQNVKDTAEELELRLSTTPQAVDFDAYGNYTLSSLFAKATPDFILDSSEVYYRNPSVELANRGQLVNKVNVNFGYRYQRLHHVKRDFVWDPPTNDDVFLFLRNTMCFRDMVTQAVDAAGWPLQGLINFTPIWPSGWYGNIGWSTVKVNYSYSTKKDKDGNIIKDSKGNDVMFPQTDSYVDFAPMYCMGASWSATTRFSQTISEDFTFSVTAPQSTAQYGVIERDESYSTEDDYDVSIWEDYSTYTNLGLGSNSFNVNADVNRANTSSAISTVLNKARTTILKSHRATRVNFSKFLWPQVDLKHTVEVDTNVVRAKGKVYSISHRLSISTGEAISTISLALFQSQGSASDSSLVAPGRIADTVTYNNSTIYLGTHFSVGTTANPAPSDKTINESWNGHITDGFKYPNGNSVSPQFIVDVPAIPSALRDNKDLSASQSYNVSIPDDDLEIIL